MTNISDSEHAMLKYAKTFEEYKSKKTNNVKFYGWMDFHLNVTNLHKF